MSIEKEIEELKIINQQMAEKIKELESQNKKELNKLPRVESQTYYYITSNSSVNTFGVLNTVDAGGGFDNAKYNQYNYFTDVNKAQQYADHMKLQLELFQIRDMINGDWKPDWKAFSKKYSINAVDNNINIGSVYNFHTSFVFETEQKRDKFIELVGEDKIMKYLSF